jgi:hypothetical protein
MRRFYPYAEIVDLFPADNGVQLLTKKGTVNLATSPARHRSYAQYYERRDAVAVRIREGLTAFRAGQGAANVAALVSRSGRTAEDWLKALRDLATGGEYRSAAVPSDQLWRIAEDPSSPPSARVGAAVALRSSLDEAGRSRLRAAASATVSPRVRVALDRAASAEADDTAMREALQQCEEEEDARAAC